MQTTNPDVIPRNHKVEQAIEAAYKNDINPTKELLKALQNPYKYNENFNEYKLHLKFRKNLSNILWNLK